MAQTTLTATQNAGDGAIGSSGPAADGCRVGRRSLLTVGLAAAGQWMIAGCGGGDGAPAPPARVDRQRRPDRAPVADPRPAPPSVEPEVRVRFARLRSGETLRVSPAGRWLKLEDDGDRGGAVFEGGLRLEPVDGGWRLVPERGPVLRVPLGPLECSTLPGEPTRLRIERGGARATTLPGRLVVVPTGGTRSPSSDLVSIKPIESYLPGVLAKELFGHWSPACFRAQAIAARSFAICEASHWRSRRHYDLTAGPDTQAWESIELDSDLSGPEIEAVAATRGVVLTWGGLVVPTYFSSACGGLPATARDAIGSNPANAIAPLEGRSDRDRCCDEAPTYRWNRRVPTTELARGLAEWGRREQRRDAVDLSSLRDIAVEEVNRHGRPVSFELTDRRGRRGSWKSETLRRGLAAAMPSGTKPIYSSALEADLDATSARFFGRGHGHGVGLCQYGAEAMGARGLAAERILERYYPGAWLHAAWS